MPGLSCGIWDLTPCRGVELAPPALGVQSLSHWTTREVPGISLTGEKGETGFLEPTGCVYSKMLQRTGRKYFLREEINMYTYPTLCNPLDYSPPGSSVPGVLQARILEWAAIPFSRGSSRPGMEPASPALPSALAGRFFPTEPPGRPPSGFIVHAYTSLLAIKEENVFTSFVS